MRNALKPNKRDEQQESRQIASASLESTNKSDGRYGSAPGVHLRPLMNRGHINRLLQAILLRMNAENGGPPYVLESERYANAM